MNNFLDTVWNVSLFNCEKFKVLGGTISILVETIQSLVALLIATFLPNTSQQGCAVGSFLTYLKASSGVIVIALILPVFLKLGLIRSIKVFLSFLVFQST